MLIGVESCVKVIFECEGRAFGMASRGLDCATASVRPVDFFCRGFRVKSL